MIDRLLLVAGTRDEGGGCLGLYRAGVVNTRLAARYDLRGGHTAWGESISTSWNLRLNACTPRDLPRGACVQAGIGFRP